MTSYSPIIIATRGSALAMAQTNLVLARCRLVFPDMDFQIKAIKTTGDKLHAASLAQPDASLPKGLFTKELEVALLNGKADLAVHSLKDLPTDLPPGLALSAVCQRADVRDVLICRDPAFWREQPKQGAANHAAKNPPGPVKRGFNPTLSIMDLPPGATIATSSTRRQAQLLALRPDLKMAPIRGNISTRLRKLAEQAEIDAMLLAAAGLARLHFEIAPDGRLRTPPELESNNGFLATRLEPDEMLPCVGQGAIGVETRANDRRIAPLCQVLDDYLTHQCVIAERAFLRAMGGGCQSPVAAYAQIEEDRIHLRAVSFRDGPARRAEGRGEISQAAALGEQVAQELMPRQRP
jgi:hydroxymethylbilane synthase